MDFTEVLDEWNNKKADVAKENLEWYKKLESKITSSPDNPLSTSVDEAISQHHTEVFAKMDCIACANCCTILKPYFEQDDINRIAKHIGMDPFDFAIEYLEYSNFKDFRMHSKPCKFLKEGACSIYEVRPQNCRDYPHTNRQPFIEHGEMIAEHTEVCPAVFKILEKMKSQFLTIEEQG